MKILLLVFLVIVMDFGVKQKPLISVLDKADFEKILAQFPKVAEVKISKNGYVYGLIRSKLLLDIKDKIDKKFGTKLVSVSDIGPHVSIFYEGEGAKGRSYEEGYNFSFDIKDIAKVSLFERTFYVLLVDSKFISESRLSKQLTRSPLFKGVMVPPHITIGEEL